MNSIVISTIVGNMLWLVCLRYIFFVDIKYWAVKGAIWDEFAIIVTKLDLSRQVWPVTNLNFFSFHPVFRTIRRLTSECINTEKLKKKGICLLGRTWLFFSVGANISCLIKGVSNSSVPLCGGQSKWEAVLDAHSKVQYLCKKL